MRPRARRWQTEACGSRHPPDKGFTHQRQRNTGVPFLERENVATWATALSVPNTTCDQFNTTGKSLLIFRNRVKPRKQKYFAFPEGANQCICSAIPAHTRGASRSSRNVGPGL